MKFCLLILIVLGFFQEEKFEDDSLPVNVSADPSECRLDAVSGSYTIHVPQLHLLITARNLSRLPAGHY